VKALATPVVFGGGGGGAFGGVAANALASTVPGRTGALGGWICGLGGAGGRWTWGTVIIGTGT
jgi:hypothetical protein